jgi:hypothetical protein
VARLVTWLVAVAIAATTATAAPAYPVRWVKLTPDQVAARVAAFRARNPQHWTGVFFDEYGHLNTAATDDPALVAGDVATLRDLVRRNADVFGIDPAVADQLARDGDAIRWTDAIDGVVRGQIVFVRSVKERTIQARYFIPVQPVHEAAEATNRLVGQRYTEVVTYGFLPERDCAMTPAGPAGCTTTVVGTTKRELAITSKDLRVQTLLTRDGDAIRLVRCAEIAAKPRPRDPSIDSEATVMGLEYVPVSRAPALPLVLDAITGEVVHLHESTCNLLHNVR